MPKQLTVYKASAGSGKTFTLAAEYIKLLIAKPRSYENILAVTFTNKATEEMKNRILSQLYGIANHLPDSENYTEKVCKELMITEDEAAERAQLALRLLLHNYNFFKVQTIDTFFQGVMRNLARELALNNNLRISLNDKEVISQAVDSMMETLSNDKQLMTWVEEYVNESMDDEKSWNITDEIKSFGKNLTKEFYKTNKDRLESVFNDPQFFVQYKKKLRTIIRQLEDKYVAFGIRFYDMLNNAGLQINDFSYGASGAPRYFIKLANKHFHDADIISSRVSNAIHDNKGWCSAKSPDKATILSLAESAIIPLFNEVESHRIDDVRIYNSARKTLQNINKLRLLHSIEDEINRLNGEHSRFLLSGTQSLLHEMIKGEDNVAPFIFEKIGTRIKHIMIDEFQDTSRVQWANFKVLLDECMASPEYPDNDERTITNNLIVGDVKQSIYRFRSGDWQLLNNIDNDFASNSLLQMPLDTNYRSERNIIDFNNIFFHIASMKEADRIMPYDTAAAQSFIESNGYSSELAREKTEWATQLRKAYSGVCQHIPAKREVNGEVRIRLIRGTKDDTTEASLNYILDNIQRLITDGVKMSNIAILVRKNKEIPAIAEYINKHAPQLKLISEEAFRLDSSPAVMMIICALKYLSHPSDKMAIATLTKLYCNIIANNGNSPILDSDLLPDIDSAIGLLPQDIADTDNHTQLQTKPLHELAEYLFRTLHLEQIEGQTIYVSTFFDKMNNYVSDNGSQLEDFLAYWDEEMCGKTVAVGNIDGIRIMSMHKSKGLEFDHVIIPFCNWGITAPFSETLWCNVKDKPFSELPFIPVEYRSEGDLMSSIYELDGSREAMQEIVDHLNLLYVAFTRAGKSLIVVGDISKKEDTRHRAALIADTLRAIASHPSYIIKGDNGDSEEHTLNGIEFTDFDDADDAVLDFSFGTLKGERNEERVMSKHERGESKTRNVFLQEASNIEVRACSYENESIEFRQSNSSKDFADDVTDEDDRKRFIHNGTILHHIFSSIETSADIDKALRELEFEGLIYNEGTTADQLRNELHSKLNDPQVAEWFSPHWRVFNECALLYTDADGKIVERRPDRVISDGNRTIVIDYKFGKPHHDHIEQVKQYMDILRRMGHNNVEGFVWYVNLKHYVQHIS